jgi:hypothetical protein
MKEQHVPDVAIQRYCFEGAGFPIRRAYVMHVDRDYVRQGNVDPGALFKSEDATAVSAAHLKEIDANLAAQFAVLKSNTEPDIGPGPQCTRPYECPYFEYCNKDPGAGSVCDLVRGGRKIAQLGEAGIGKLADIDESSCPLNAVQHAQVESARKGRPIVDTAALQTFLKQLKYPLYYLDFESTACAIPLFDYSRPWQNVPFQMSLHVQDSPGGRCRHQSFLPDSREDPRGELCAALLKALGKKGSILAWHAPFEKHVIRELSLTCPRYAPLLSALGPRFADLMVPFKNGWYMDWRFRGSASLKAVLPVMVPRLSYDTLEIGEGSIASARACRWYLGDTSDREWKKDRGHLLKYCGRDTLAMVKILDKLRAVC